MMARILSYRLPYYLLGLWVLLLSGCNKSEIIEGLSVDATEFNDISLYGGKYKILVTSSEEWSADASDTWISPNATKGLTRTLITVDVSANLTGEERTGTLTLRTKEETVDISFKQLGGDLSTDKMDSIRYTIPVVFHVLYCSDKDSIDQRVPADRIRKLLRKVNQLYHGDIYNDRQNDYALPEKNDLGVEFVLADKDPSGKILSEPGVNRVEVSTKTIDYRKVMGDPAGGEYSKLSWDRTRYINIFVFRFTDDDDPRTTGIIMGSAHLPYYDPRRPIEGLQPYNENTLKNYNHCVVINTAGIYLDRNGFNLPERLRTDAATTIAHELGHYLGLYHVFSETHQGETTQMTDDCNDTDYCEDTPSYNRVAYQKQLLALSPSPIASEVVGLFNRTNCSGSRFTSYNIMDYELTDSFHFTPEQKMRVRLCLYTSPVVPGQKIHLPDNAGTRSVNTPTTPLRSICSHTSTIR